MILTAMIALAVGLSIGGAVGIVWTRRSRAATTATRPTEVTPAPTRPSTATDAVDGGLAEAVDHLEIGVLIARVDGTVEYRNSAAAEFAGTHVGVIIDDHVASTVDATGGGARANRLVELQGPPKTWLEIAADPMPDGRAVVTIRDVTERARTDAMRTDFVTNISHELKTPVGAVAVLAEAMIDETDPDVMQRLADHLVDESHRAVRTIDDLLKLSQIETARPVDERVDLASVVHSAIARGRVVEGGRGVQIQSIEPPDPIVVLGDERQLVSALGNLVENGVKYSNSGDVVEIRTRLDDRSVEVMVADQGVGIPARDLDRIFERFYRVDKARSRDTGGTGLGLSIVRHVATNHGGEVLVSSQEGEGSTFVLRLPASRTVIEQPAGATEHSPDLPASNGVSPT